MQTFSREMPGVAAWCPLIGGVRLLEMSAYGTCPLTRGVRLRGVKNEEFQSKRNCRGRGPLFGVRLWEVSPYGRCPLAEVRLCLHSMRIRTLDCRVTNPSGRGKGFELRTSNFKSSALTTEPHFCHNSVETQNIYCSQLIAVLFQIWDSNVFFDSFLGQAKMTIDINNRIVLLSHQLMGRRRKENERMPGSVTLEIACYHDLLAV